MDIVKIVDKVVENLTGGVESLLPLLRVEIIFERLAIRLAVWVILS